MTTKHIPATPLPQNKPAGMTQRDWESTTHRRETTRRANAYPQLVEALKSIAALDEQEDDETHERAIEQIVAMGNIARALLRSLGEDA